MSGVETTVSITTIFANTTSNELCNGYLKHGPILSFYAVVSSILIICNTVILIAVAKNWMVLRQNVVYRYLVSCLISAIAFCTTAMIDMLVSYVQFNSAYVEGGVLQRYNWKDDSHIAIMKKDSYVKGLLVALLLIMQFNVAAVLYGVSDNTVYVSRSGQIKDDNRRNAFRSRSKQWKRYKSVFVIAFAWFVPLVLSLPVGFSWNCIEQCKCLPVYRLEPYCFSTHEVSCSRIWPPMSRSYVIVTTVLYFGTVLCMVLTLISTIRQFYVSHAPANVGGDRTKEPQGVATAAQIPDSSGTIRFAMNSEKNSSCRDQSSVERTRSYSIASTIYGRRRSPPLDNTIKLLIVLTVTLFVSMTPLMLVWFLDILLDEAPNVNVLLFTLAMTYLYAACLPFIMLKYMNGLRNTCIKILIICPCTSTTSVTSGPTLKESKLAQPSGELNLEVQNDVNDVTIVSSDL
ncbi:uncharacterized protein LOC120341087 isoform X1 [Styela clava]